MSDVRRRSLTHVGGRVTLDGAREEAQSLAHALDVAPSREDDDDPARAHIHGFHVYPARMHPDTAARLVELTSFAGGRVLDPFCGSGTVLACALLARREAIGTDLNPLAVLLATRKIAPCDAAHDEKLTAAAARVREHADARRTKKAGAHKRYGPDDVAAFDPHVLLELDSIRDAIERETDGIVRDDLRVVLSAILTKVSRKKADTSHEEAPKRIAAGYPAKLFVKKTAELVARRLAFAEKLPSPRPRAFVFTDDARELSKVRDGECTALVTSPPYVGTYDYAAHHALRMRWLGLHSRRLEEKEIGARREFGRGGPNAERDWERQLEGALHAMHRTLAKKSRAAFVVADSELGGRAVRADATLATLGPRAGFTIVARASQPRAHFHDHRAFSDVPRFEHAILLERV
jgi:methylase of polypeptide subunit release factors